MGMEREEVKSNELNSVSPLEEVALKDDSAKKFDDKQDEGDVLDASDEPDWLEVSQGLLELSKADDSEYVASEDGIESMRFWHNGSASDSRSEDAELMRGCEAEGSEEEALASKKPEEESASPEPERQVPPAPLAPPAEVAA